jgi:hypothetical protein
MTWYFETDTDGEADPGGPGVESIPAALLARHGAKVLDPATAVVPEGWTAPRSTVYRTRTLLIPGDILAEQPTVIADTLAGIVRQVVPDAQVLAIRIMHSDGFVYEGDLMCALGLLSARVAGALDAGDMSLMVDVVSLSLGYFSESAADVAYSSALRQVISSLLASGVMVTAAAGNYATTRRYYPAAFASAPLPGPGTGVVSVGALNPNGTKAMFSDGGCWVRTWGTGAEVVSTYPDDVRGSRDPVLRLPGRESLDPDDYRAGFATWSGTSFAAPYLAAVMTDELLRLASRDTELRLDVPKAEVVVHRANGVLAALSASREGASGERR